MRARETRTSRGRLLKLPPVWVPLLTTKFGRLRPLGFTGTITKHDQKMITCRCDCGLYVDVMPASLRSGLTKSCGCLHTETVAVMNVETADHGETAGGVLTPMYRVWTQMKARCYNTKHAAYKHYGGRGILMHPAWCESFVVFSANVRDTIGDKPGRRYSIDRIDNDRGYVPGNIRWSLPKVQVRNRRTTRKYVIDGEARSLGEWTDLAGVDYNRVEQRVRVLGWPLDEALGTPFGPGSRTRRKWKRPTP